jgi:predicted dehydrogenase
LLYVTEQRSENQHIPIQPDYNHRVAQLHGCLAGCGFFAQFQMDAWNRMKPEAAIAAVCDLDGSRAQAFAERFGVPRFFTSYEEMLAAERPAFVDIVTRPELHRPMVETAAAAGVHILCQKPFSPTIADAEAMAAVCVERGVRLMVNENWRWQAWYREIRWLLDSGAIGEPFAFRWIHRANDGLLEPPYPNQPYFAGYPRFLIYETLVHYLDCARFLFGEPEWLECETARINPKIAGEDAAWITLRFPGSLRGVIDGNRCSPPDEPGDAMGNLRIDGTGGTLWLAGDGRITIEPRGGERREHSWAIPSQGYRGDSCYLTQRHFVDCLISGATFESTPEDYLRTMRLVEACYESAA